MWGVGVNTSDRSEQASARTTRNAISYQSNRRTFHPHKNVSLPPANSHAQRSFSQEPWHKAHWEGFSARER